MTMQKKKSTECCKIMNNDVQNRKSDRDTIKRVSLFLWTKADFSGIINIEELK